MFSIAAFHLSKLMLVAVLCSGVFRGSLKPVDSMISRLALLTALSKEVCSAGVDSGVSLQQRMT